MRLIDISRFPEVQFRIVADPTTIRYAIFSHVWNKENDVGGFIPEPTYQDLMEQCPAVLPLESKFEKLRSFCRVAFEDGYTLVWADMCCINKSSSAEESESIASMFYWYQCAEVCYAYLKDVPCLDDDGMHHLPSISMPKVLSLPGAKSTLSRVHSPLRSLPPVGFATSVWFTRGWTLQELIAPRSVVFLSQEWKVLGSKRGRLARTIHNITHIDLKVLTHERKLEDVSIACRISWAANRRTERSEDRAYSLMGILGVRIPVSYGEREYAFIRLQEEVLRVIPDPSLFAWGTLTSLSDLHLQYPEDTEDLVDPVHVRARDRFSFCPGRETGYLLAPSPEAFQQTVRLTGPTNCGPAAISRERSIFRGGGPSSLNPVSFHMFEMTTTVVPLVGRLGIAAGTRRTPHYLALLGCETPKGEPIALLLCPGAARATSSANSVAQHRYWTIGTRFQGLDHRIVALPSPRRRASSHTKPWEKALSKAKARQDRKVILPLSAPMSSWNAGYPQMHDEESRLRFNRGSFDINWLRWSQAGLEASGFSVATVLEGPNARIPLMYRIRLFPPTEYDFYVQDSKLDASVQLIEVSFANCLPPLPCDGSAAPPTNFHDEESLFRLVGRIDVYVGPNTPSETQACPRNCIAADPSDHIDAPGAWSLHGGVAVRTLKLVGRAADETASPWLPPDELDTLEEHDAGSAEEANPSGTLPKTQSTETLVESAPDDDLVEFTLTLGLRALLPNPGEPAKTTQTYLLEIEFYPEGAISPVDAGFSLPD